MQEAKVVVAEVWAVFMVVALSNPNLQQFQRKWLATTLRQPSY